MTFLNEINEQPQALQAWALWSSRPDVTTPIREFLSQHAHRRIIFSGMGSSLFSAMTAAHLLHQNGRVCQVCDAQELLSHYTSLLDDQALFVLISQSGTSAEPLQLAQQMPGRYLAITNQPDSPLARMAAGTIPLCAGAEHHTTSKTYTNSIAALLSVARWLMDDPSSAENLWRQAAEEMARLIRCAHDYLPAVLATLQECTSVAIIGSGASLANACQAQLVLTEVAHLPAIAYTPGQFLHGPIEAIDRRFCAIVLDTMAGEGQTDKIIDEIMRYEGRVVCISTKTETAARDGIASIPLRWPLPMFAEVLEIVPIELLADSLAMAKGLEPGRLLRTQK